MEHIVDSEYAKMAEADRNMWWYRALQRRVVSECQRVWGGRRDISIVDVGCGTGGLLLFLKSLGYTNLRGIDSSSVAIRYCQSRGLDCEVNDLATFATQNPQGVDVVILSDVLCYVPTRHERIALLSQVSSILKPEGVVVIHNPALECLKGQHDVAVGLKGERPTRNGLRNLLLESQLDPVHVGYRMFLLTPIYFVMRSWQRCLMKLFGSKMEVESDVKIPHPFLNWLLEKSVTIDDLAFRHAPVGPALIAVAGRKSP